MTEKQTEVNLSDVDSMRQIVTYSEEDSEVDR